jgi:hypothetical protein
MAYRLGSRPTRSGRHPVADHPPPRTSRCETATASAAENGRHRSQLTRLAERPSRLTWTFRRCGDVDEPADPRLVAPDPGPGPPCSSEILGWRSAGPRSAGRDHPREDEPRGPTRRLVGATDGRCRPETLAMPSRSATDSPTAPPRRDGCRASDALTDGRLTSQPRSLRVVMNCRSQLTTRRVRIGRTRFDIGPYFQPTRELLTAW